MGVWMSRSRTWYLPRLDLIRLDGLDPVGIGVLTRSDGVTTGFPPPPQRFSFVWRSIVVNLLKTVGRIDRLRLSDTSHMESPVFSVVPSLTEKSVAKIEVHVIVVEMGVL